MLKAIWIAIVIAITSIAFVSPVVAMAIEIEAEDIEWGEFWQDSFEEHADEFTALFNSYEVKRAKNGALMIRQGDSGSYRFARKSA